MVFQKIIAVVFLILVIGQNSIAGPFSHCASTDAVCVGEELLRRLENSSSAGGTFCACEEVSGGECHAGHNYYRPSQLRLKSISTGKTIADLSGVISCSETQSPEQVCFDRLKAHPSCRH